MKKAVLFLLTTLIIFSVSCSNTKVLEENTKENNLGDKYKITERTVKNNFEDKRFIPLVYDEDGVNGILDTTKLGVINEEDHNIPYMVNENGEFRKANNKFFINQGLNFVKSSGRSSYKGIYSEGLHTRDQKFYYIDLLKEIKIKLEGYENIYYKMIDEYKGVHSVEFQINDDYYIKLNEPMKEGNALGIQEIVVVDIKNNTFYSSDLIELQSNYYYYNYREKAIMTIDRLGKVSKVILKDSKVTFEDYKDINLRGYKVGENYVLKSTYTIDDNLILKLRDEKDFIVDAIYNIYSNEIYILDDKKKVISKIENTNFLLVNYNNGTYISELDTLGNLKLIYKLSDGENYDNIIAVSNKDGSSIFFTSVKYDVSEGAVKFIKDIKYLFIDINKI
ncbi:hypothetical protein JCM1393_04010 [Clostridium carnis]